MRLFHLTLFLSALILQSGFAQVTKKPILFLGSELISKNKLPQLVKFLVEEASQFTLVEPYLYAPAGFRMQWMNTFENAYNFGEAKKFWSIPNIKKYAILQERPEVLLSDHIKAIQPLENAVLEFTQDKRDPYILNCTPYLLCPYLPKEKADQQEALNEKLQKLADQRKIVILPVAQIWREIESKNEKLYLYHANDEFPSQYGTYLTACVILEKVFKISAVGRPTTFEVPTLPVPLKYQLNPEQAKIIQNAVHEVCWK